MHKLFSQLNKANQCHTSKVLTDDICNQGEDDYSDLKAVIQ